MYLFLLLQYIIIIYQNVEEDESPLRKRRRTSTEANNNNTNNNNNNVKVNAVWYWNGDSSKNSQQDIWIQYEDDVCEKIEKVQISGPNVLKRRRCLVLTYHIFIGL